MPGSSGQGRYLKAGPLVRNAIALMISAGGSAVLGAVFWEVAAHLAPQAVVGRVSAEIAAMTMLATLAQLSFGSIFERFLSVAGEATFTFIARAYALCLGFALAISGVYVFSALGRDAVPHSLLEHFFFVAVVMLWTIFILQDSVLIGLRVSRWVAVENIAYSVAKLALLPALLSASARQGIFLAWSIPVVAVVIGVNWYLFRRRIPEHMGTRAPREKLPKVRELITLAGAQYATLLFSVFTPSIVTLIVISRLGPVASAHYYIPQLIVGGLSLLNLSIVRSFLVEAATEPYAMRRHAFVATRAMLVVVVPSVLVGVIFAPLILRIFGAAYATYGTTLLRMMLLSLPFSAISVYYSVFAWLDRRVWWMSARDAISAVIFFTVLLTLIGRLGVNAIGVAYLVSAGLLGIFFLPISIRRYRSTENVPPPTTFESPGSGPSRPLSEDG